MLIIDETKSVAIGKAGRSGDIERASPDFLHLANILAQCLRRVGRIDVRLSAMQEIIGISPVESLLQVGLKVISHPPQRCPAVVIPALLDDAVQPLRVGRHHVFDILHILQSAFYLERTDARIGHFFQVINLTQVFQRQQMALMFYLTPLRVNQIELHPTELCACTAVGTALKTILRGIAHTRVTHAQRTVHEAFQLHVRHGLVDGFDFGKRQFARQYNALEAQTMQPSHLFGRPIVGLRTGMEGRQGLHVLGQQVEYGHVLHQ